MSFSAVETIEGDDSKACILIADHARAALPADANGLGLPPERLLTHIAYDIGVADMTTALARLMGVPAVMAGFSRLWIDPNRGADDPTLIRQIYDGIVIPGNRNLGPVERAARIAGCYAPYHDAIDAMIARVEAASGKPPLVIAMHSFTPALKDGRTRPWQIGLLSDRDRRATDRLAARLAERGGLIVGDNEPYDGAFEGDTMYRHCTSTGLPQLLIEVRQDLINSPKGAEEAARWLAPLLDAVNADADIHERRRHGSRVGPA